MLGQKDIKFFCVCRRILIAYSRNWTGSGVSVTVTNNLMNVCIGGYSYLTNRHALRNAITGFKWNEGIVKLQ